MVAFTLGSCVGVQILNVFGEVLCAYIPHFQRGGFEPPPVTRSVESAVLIHQFVEAVTFGLIGKGIAAFIVQ